MEIITYVREGAITHKDSQGNEGRTPAGDVQVMSAGTGIRHAEYNLEPGTPRIFQIWILPDRRGEKPSWGAKPFPKGDRPGDRESVVYGKSVSVRVALGGPRIIKKKRTNIRLAHKL